ncbi:MAG: molybdenum cofactor guanylyltransferase [Nitrososphaerales archaeon]
MKATVILSGGQSKRMGLDKGLLPLNNKPLILHVFDAVKNFSDEIIISLSRNSIISKYAEILPNNVHIVIDSFPIQSPVVGIYSGLSKTSADYAFIVSCDMPFVNSNIVKFLFDEAIGFDAAIPKWPNGLIEPLHAVYKVETALIAAKEACEYNEMRNTDIIKRLKKVNYISTNKLKEFDYELHTFFNINTLDDFKNAVEILKRKVK